MTPEIDKINQLRATYQNAQQAYLLLGINNLDRVLGSDQPDPQQYDQASQREARLHDEYRAAATRLSKALMGQK
jgi:hypothetical protein